ncbi:MAG: anthrone oxygenase family protein [Candidatus Eiseniibacteriota bacterium]
MRETLALAFCLGAGTVGGVFFAFSTFVMKALSRLPAAAGVTAMQRINVVVLNPLFLGAFVGTAALAAACVVASLRPWHEPRSLLLLAGGVLYLGGSFALTIAFHVPRNDALAKLDADSAEAAARWARYLREWTAGNHVRTAASLGAALCSALSLAV